MASPHGHGPGTMEKPDLREKSRSRDGSEQFCDKRLFMQLQVYRGCENTEELVKALESSGLKGALYLDVNDPTGIALLSVSEDPALFTEGARELQNQDCFKKLTHDRSMTMLGRTYAIGHEANLEDWVLKKPLRNVTNKNWPWVVWYPLKRKPSFNALPAEEQGAILREHGMIGRSFGEAGYAADIRLACFGLDKNDNDFVIGILGPELFPLSKVVQEMRKTKQTSEYMDSMGPFFVGRALWQSS